MLHCQQGDTLNVCLLSTLSLRLFCADSVASRGMPELQKRYGMTSCSLHALPIGDACEDMID